jgi:hypothetical protein
MTERRVPPPEALEQAARFPGGWVYEIDGSNGPEDAVPPEAIRGAWQVRPDGTLPGEFKPNPGRRPQVGDAIGCQGRRTRFRRCRPHLTATVIAVRRAGPPPPGRDCQENGGKDATPHPQQRPGPTVRAPTPRADPGGEGGGAHRMPEATVIGSLPVRRHRIVVAAFMFLDLPVPGPARTGASDAR